MQIIHSSIISFFITSFVIGFGSSQVQSLSEEHFNSAKSLDNSGFNQLEGEHNSHQESQAASSGINRHYLSPEQIASLVNPSSIVTAIPLDAPQYVYPEKKLEFMTTEVPVVEEDDSQIAQPDFSPEQLDENKQDIEVPTDAQSQQLDTNKLQSTNTSLEETTLQDIEDEVTTHFDNLGEVSNNLDVETDGGTDDNENDGENETQVDEPLPNPIALISSNGEGSNPPLEEEFAEAFKRVGPNGRRRRVRPGGRRRVRMRVRKINRENSTHSSVENETPYPTQNSYSEDPNYEFETTTVRPRRYRSTTPLPDPNLPTIPLSGPASSSVVKNGPKPLIITDIHSGSTGINHVTPEPQLEKPMIGGYTEKISTYFVSPPTRISTTEPPKLPGNMSIDDPDWNSIGDSKPLASILQGNSSPYENQREAWTKNLMNAQQNAFFATSTESTDRSQSFAPPPKSGIETSLLNENTENSLQQPPMEDRTYNVNDQGNNEHNGFETGNSFDQTPASQNHGTGQSNDFINPFGFSEDSENHQGSNDPSQQTFSHPPFVRYEENVPFVTHGHSPTGSHHGLPPTGSHYDRNKDPYLNGNQQFFKENSPILLSNHDHSPIKSQSEFERPHDNNQAYTPQFENNEFSSTLSPNADEYQLNDNPQENYRNPAENNIPMNDYNKSPQYLSDAFKSSPEDPALNGILRNNERPYPPFRRHPEFTGNGFGFRNPNSSPSVPNGPSAQEVHNGPIVQDGISQTVLNYPPNSFNSPSEFSQYSGGGPIQQTQYSQGTQNPSSSSNLLGYPQDNKDISFDPSTFTEAPLGNPRPLQPPTGPVFGTVENVPVFEHNGDQNHIQPDHLNAQRYPVFVANSPGEPSRNPKFLPQRPQGPPPYHRGLPFFRNPFRHPGPPMHPHPPRYFSQQSINGQDYRGDAVAHPSNYRGSEGPFGRIARPEFQNTSPRFNLHMPEQHGRPPPDFQNTSPNVNLPIPGLQSIPPPPTEQQALSEVSPIHHFPPHAHSMSDKPDYEPANPPLPHGHPLEHHFDVFTGNNNGGDNTNHLNEVHLNNFDNSNNGGQHESSSGGPQLTGPSVIINDEPTQNSNGHDFDILSAYYDKPPPTVGYDYNNQYRMKESPVKEVKDNDLLNVPYQYSNTDGGGLDSGPYYHDFESNKAVKEKPKENKPEAHQTEPPSHQNEDKNKSSVYSDTPYVLMFPQLVPQEAMVPPPPKMLTKEIPVVSASSMSAMRFTPEGKPVLGPGLKAVPVHPRHQMYQVLAKAHYDKTMQKYLESKKKAPSAIYTPYGVLVPMGPSGSASTNQETYATMQSQLHQHHHHPDPHDKQLLNLLLGKKTPFGNLFLNKGTGIKNGRLKKHFDFKANIDPALDLLAEKLALKLGAVKYVLSAPAKLGIHAFSKHATSYSELNPVTVPNPAASKEKGETGQFGSAASYIAMGNQGLGTLHSGSDASKTEGKSLQESNPDLKNHLKRLLKERLKEVLDEVEAESKEHVPTSSRNNDKHNIKYMIPMSSSVVETRVPPPNSNMFSNYFMQSNQPGGGGLIGTIKRLFSFGGSDNSRSDGNGRSDGGGGFSNLGSSPSARNTSNHPFAWYGLNALNSIGRMGSIAQQSPLPPPQESMQTASKWKSEKKATKQLEKWLDIVLKSSETSSSYPNQKPMELNKFSTLSEKNRKTKQSYYLNPLLSASSSPNLRVIPPMKLTPILNLLSPQKPENLLKRLGEPTGTVSSTILTNTWKPVVSAFKNVFSYPSGKGPTILKQKTM